MVTAARQPGPDPGAIVARAVLYEGYVLWPYRKGGVRSRRRWTVGGVHPRAWTEAGHEDDPWTVSTECVAHAPDASVEADGPSEGPPKIRATVRFLQFVERSVARQSAGGLEVVDELIVNGERLVSREEAREREVRLAPMTLQDHAAVQVAFDIPAAMHREWLPDGRGAVVHSWQELSGNVRVSCRRLRDDVFRVGVQTWNTTAWEGSDRDSARRSSFASTHVVLEAEGCAFVSSTDPPDELQALAETCKNRGLWPVLVGERGSTSTVLAAPVILPDYPQIALDRPGDLFDGAEIDEMLTLHVLAPEEEEPEPRSPDISRRVLGRATARSREQMLGMPGGASAPPEEGSVLWKTEASEASHGDVTLARPRLAKGSRVRLRPRSGGDVFDMILEGRTAVVESLEEDEEGVHHVSVLVEEDPGIDLGPERQAGRRFFFRSDEVEPIVEEAASAVDVPEEPTGAATVLVGGIGNVSLGDDGFGIEVARRLRSEPLPDEVVVRDFGIRGLDLAYAFAEHDVVVLIDAVPRGGEPGTLYVMDAIEDEGKPTQVQTHGLDTTSVIALARALGTLPPRMYIVGCEPAFVPHPEGGDVVTGLSGPVQDAVEVAVERVKALVREVTEGPRGGRGATEG